MIQIASAPASPAPAAPRAAPVAASGVSGFAVALATLLLPGADAEAGRQAIAEGGKKLPGDAEADKDGEADAPDARFAWFAAPVIPEPVRTGFSAVPAQPPAVPRTVPEGGIPAAPPRIGAARPQAGSDAPVLPMAGEEQAVAPLPDADAAPAKIAPGPDFPLRSETPRPEAPARAVALPRVEIALDAPAVPDRPVALPPVPFTLDPPAAPRRPAREAMDGVFAPPSPDAPSAPAVAAPAQTQQAALDTRRHEWMGRMIDRIEAMRDASPGGDTRIRLAPDALGQVDISIRQEGERIHVHFATETQAARQLLTDAQPRLAELAEARGVKLGQATVDNGAAGQGQQQNMARQPVPARPAGAPAAEASTESDQRIA